VRVVTTGCRRVVTTRLAQISAGLMPARLQQRDRGRRYRPSAPASSSLLSGVPLAQITFA